MTSGAVVAILNQLFVRFPTLRYLLDRSVPKVSAQDSNLVAKLRTFCVPRRVNQYKRMFDRLVKSQPAMSMGSRERKYVVKQ